MTLKERISIQPLSFKCVLEVRYLRELPNRAVAVALDTGSPAIKTRVSRARVFANASHNSMPLPQVAERASRTTLGVKHDVCHCRRRPVGAGYWRVSGLGVALYDAINRPGDPVRVSFLEPRPYAKRVYTDANQVCWNKAKLRRAKGN
jgi:hypothetical protein